MSHTKGPWSSIATPSSSLHDIRYISGPDCEKIATICIPPDMDQKTALANARLIKHAPDLLGELDSLYYQFFTKGKSTRFQATLTFEQLEKVSSLLEKVKGESSDPDQMPSSCQHVTRFQELEAERIKAGMKEVQSITDAILGLTDTLIQTGHDPAVIEQIQRLSRVAQIISEGAVKMPEYGSWFKIAEDGSLLDCAMLDDESPGTTFGEINWGEVTAPENQEFLDAINKVFGTSFQFERFAGR